MASESKIDDFGDEKSNRHSPSNDTLMKEKNESPGDVSSPSSTSINERNKEVNCLARRFSEISGWNEIPSNPLEAAKGTELDPLSPNFKARTWVKSMLKFSKQDGRTPMRTGGVAFRNLSAHGFGLATDYQKDVGNIWLDSISIVKKLFGMEKSRRIDILQDFEGLLESGEMLVVLGPPGSGCSTFLKTLTGETHGFQVDKNSYMNFQGIPAGEMHSVFRGEAIYTAEVDIHFPQLTVGETLTFAARARTPRFIPGDVERNVYAEHMRDVVMAMYGISHTINTRVGNDYLRGVSGGERKRVTIAEASLSGAALQAWDNSTRGLDSANAVEFCKSVRLGCELGGSAAMVAIYQAPRAAYEQFDKVIVLYEGRQIYFGNIHAGKTYFEDLGFQCPDRQTTPDFLTSMTSAVERVVKPGWEDKVPRSPDEFAAAWKASPTRQKLIQDIEDYERRFPFKGEAYQQFVDSRKAQKAKSHRFKSPYTISYLQQCQVCLWRGYRRLCADPELLYTSLFMNSILALIVGTLFYNLKLTTASFYQRGAVIFFGTMMNAFGSSLEILTLYHQRPIVEKHERYALYHPSAEAVASMIMDLPYKISNCIIFNTVLYFMVNLRREPGAFFFFIFLAFITTLTMSMMFRTIASCSRTLSQAMTPSALILLWLLIFTGFAIPVDYMLGWCRWLNYIDPVAYAFESLMINEFSGRNYACKSDDLVPSYGTLAAQSQVCNAVGAVAGRDYVEGEAYINSAYSYYRSHKWRNIGIIFAFMVGFLTVYLVASENIRAKKSKGEVLLFQKGRIPAALKEKSQDEEMSEVNRVSSVMCRQMSNVEATDVILRQTAVFSWRNVCYDIKIKGEERRILDNVDGWVKPGTLTALMGVSGAGKTTLLDVLATRVTMGVISGEMLVDGRERDNSFQRKTGYVQQQDLHLATSTVREALNFSALLRQPASVSRQEKLDYVDEVIKLLDMQEYADAVVGVPGEGLNVEQRKRLTVGVELAAKPQLLLFLDEPTSGLDSQTSWAICDLMEKLKNSGQAILCTIHQPSAMLFQRFNRLLFLAKGGKTVYFGEVGPGAKILSTYFERNGGHPCPPDANPAEWMLEVIGAAPGSRTDIDWHQVWRASPEYAATQRELDHLKDNGALVRQPSMVESDNESFNAFAAGFWSQLREVLVRVALQYWRTPSYIYAKLSLCTLAGLFIGFIFYKAPLTHQGLTNQMLSIFMIFTLFSNVSQQIMPHFVLQRSLYEARERPSKTYSWQVFLISNILIELPWNAFAGLLFFLCYYYPIGLYANASPTDSVAERGGYFFLMILAFFLFTSTFTNLMIAGMDSAETSGNIATLLFSLCLIFNGILASPKTMPKFWLFLYRVSPFTYITGGLMSAGLMDQTTHCAANEFVTFQPDGGEGGGTTCGTYMDPYISGANGTVGKGGYILNPSADADCKYCSFNTTNHFLKLVSIDPADRWRDLGITWVYILVNVAGAVALYWLFRVPKGSKKKAEKKEKTG